MGNSSSSPVVDMNGALAKDVQTTIKTNSVVVYSTTYCPYCAMAKKALQDLGVKFKLIELNKHPQGEEIRDILRVLTGARSVPRVFVNGNFIGGGTETKTLAESGELTKMLSEHSVNQNSPGDGDG
ncbi:unnamed protein product [Cyprideis torosa]|nr:unnamed protein product [Cyprideis torosa]CAG0882549.1 unnamed protein product [Cyprideis torosa]